MAEFFHSRTISLISASVEIVWFILSDLLARGCDGRAVYIALAWLSQFTWRAGSARRPLRITLWRWIRAAADGSLDQSSRSRNRPGYQNACPRSCVGSEQLHVLMFAAHYKEHV